MAENKELPYKELGIDWWEPKAGDRFWFITEAGQAAFGSYAPERFADRLMFEYGNCFKNREGAERLAHVFKISLLGYHKLYKDDNV